MRISKATKLRQSGQWSLQSGMASLAVIGAAVLAGQLVGNFMVGTKPNPNFGCVSGANCTGHKASRVTPTALVARASSNIVADSLTGLVEAISRAQDGATIQVAGGRYEQLNIKNVAFAGTVTVTSADPANPAIFAGIVIKDSAGLTFTNVVVDASANKISSPIQINGSKRVTFKQVKAGGAGYSVAVSYGPGLFIRDSQSVEISGSQFHDFWHGLGFMNVSNVRIASNQFYDLRTDGIRGGGMSDSVIEGNYLTDFHPAPLDHPDGIQLWTNDQKASARNITIRNNIVARGRGIATQGIFIRDQGQLLPYFNVSITNNIVVGGRSNGIATENMKSVTFDSNVVSGLVDRLSKLRVDASHGVSSKNNQAEKFVFRQNTTGVTQVGNKVLKAASIAEAQAKLDAWLAANPAVVSALGTLVRPMAAAQSLGPVVPDVESTTLTEG